MIRAFSLTGLLLISSPALASEVGEYAIDGCIDQLRIVEVINGGAAAQSYKPIFGIE